MALNIWDDWNDRLDLCHYLETSRQTRPCVDLSSILAVMVTPIVWIVPQFIRVERRFPPWNRLDRLNTIVYVQVNPILIWHVPVFTEFVKAALEDALAEERKRGKEFAEEIKDETKKEMLQYIRAKQEVRSHV